MTFEEALRNKKAALIDMDGVLYDSMSKHSKAWRQTMLEIGIDCPADEFFLYEGMTGPATINLLMKREKGMELPLEQCLRIYERKAELFRKMGSVETMPGAREMIESLMQRGMILVLVTGSAQNTLLSRLDKDYPGAFPLHRRVTANDVVNGKPHPEPYLKGLEKSCVNPEQAFVIENAPLGVRAGKSAGLDTVAVTTGPIPKENFIIERADFIFNSMPDFAEALKPKNATIRI